MPKLPRCLMRRGRHYHARLYEGGKERWRSLHTTDYYEACTRLREYRSGRVVLDEPDDSVPGRDTTIGTLGRLWLATYVKAKRNEKGALIAEARFTRYAERFFKADTPVGVLRSDDLWRYRLWLGQQKTSSGKRLTVQTVRHVLADVKTFLLWSVDAGDLIRSPVPRKLLPKAPELPPLGFSSEEVKKLTALDADHGFVVRFLLGTGIRWSEACRATRDDVKGGSLVVHTTKNKRLRRVPIPPPLLQEVVRREGSLVPFSQPGSFARMVRRLSGVESFRVHRCRHHYAIEWLTKGGNLKALSHALGHGSVTVTERYGKLTDQQVRDEAARIWAA